MMCKGLIQMLTAALEHRRIQFISISVIINIQQQHIKVFKWKQFEGQSEKRRQREGLPESEGKAKGSKGTGECSRSLSGNSNPFWQALRNAEVFEGGWLNRRICYVVHLC